jgi:hypothetical protein
MIQHRKYLKLVAAPISAERGNLCTLMNTVHASVPLMSILPRKIMKRELMYGEGIWILLDMARETHVSLMCLPLILPNEFRNPIRLLCGHVSISETTKEISINLVFWVYDPQATTA